MSNTRLAPTEKRRPGRPRVDAVPIMVRLPPDQLAALDHWISQQPRPVPSRPEALRRLAAIGRRSARARDPRPTIPARPAGIETPGLSWAWVAGRWVAAWQAQTKFLKLKYPTRRARLWVGVSPSLADWKKIGEACAKLQREMKEWQPGDDQAARPRRGATPSRVAAE